STASARALQSSIYRQPGVRRPVAAGQGPFVARAAERLDRTVASSSHALACRGAEEAPLRRGEAAASHRVRTALAPARVATRRRASRTAPAPAPAPVATRWCASRTEPAPARVATRWRA